jgi:diguanylate cyclase (GGDEF)-like protein/PAS domain S-box-containing protein
VTGEERSDSGDRSAPAVPSRVDVGAEPVGIDVLAHLLDTAIHPFLLIDLDGTTRWASASVTELLGYAPEDLVGRSTLELVAPESVEEAVRELASGEVYVETHTGSPAWEGLGPTLALVRADGSKVRCSLAVATPIRTGFPGYVLQLRRADSATALEETLVAMSRGHELSEVLQGVAAMLVGELPAASVSVFCRSTPDRPLEQQVGPADLADVLAEVTGSSSPWAAAFAEPGSIVERPVSDLAGPLRRRAEAAGYQWLVILVVPPGDDGRTPAVIAIWSRHAYPMHVFTYERVQRCGHLVSLVLQWSHGQWALHWDATHDVLTGLHNRAFFLNEVRAPHGPQELTVVLYLDLDDFKPVNDSHGHSVGDEALVEVAARLRACVRPDDLVARIGGDEFAVLCRGLDDLDAAAGLAGRLVTEVSRPIELDGLTVQVGLSVGIARRLQEDELEDVLERADLALRSAKEKGKSRWHLAEAPAS